MKIVFNDEFKKGCRKVAFFIFPQLDKFLKTLWTILCET